MEIKYKEYRHLWYTYIMKICSFERCNARVDAKGLCSSHYGHLKRYGAPQTLSYKVGNRKQTRIFPERSCKIIGCERKHKALDLCNIHYRKWSLYGDPLAPRPIRAKPGTYRYKKVGDKTVAIHRLVMEEKLGRKLLPGENVHHINGKQDDNRPENLELWIVSQPAGQRVEDLLEWAKEIINRYEGSSTC